MEIIPYKPELANGFISFFETVMTEMGYKFIPRTKDCDLVSIENTYQKNRGCFLLAIDAGEIFGSIGIRALADDIAELKRFYILQNHQKRGHGFLLLNQALKNARNAGFSSIRLDTTYKSSRAIELFRSCGFVEIERYNTDPFAEVFMECVLNEVA